MHRINGMWHTPLDGIFYALQLSLRRKSAIRPPRKLWSSTTVSVDELLAAGVRQVQLFPIKFVRRGKAVPVIYNLPRFA